MISTDRIYKAVLDNKLYIIIFVTLLVLIASYYYYKKYIENFNSDGTVFNPYEEPQYGLRGDLLNVQSLENKPTCCHDRRDIPHNPYSGMTPDEYLEYSS